MQKRYRFKKVLQNIMTAISVLLVAVCITGCEEPQSVPVLKNGLCIIEAAENKTLVSSDEVYLLKLGVQNTTTDEFTGTIINQTGHPVINISRSTI